MWKQGFEWNLVYLRGTENTSRKGKTYDREGRQPVMGDYLASYFLEKKHLENTIKSLHRKTLDMGCRQEMIRPALDRPPAESSQGTYRIHPRYSTWVM